MGDRYSTTKVGFGLLTPNFPWFANKQSQRYFSLIVQRQPRGALSRIAFLPT